MQCCRNSAIFIVAATLTFYQSLAAKIDVISNNGVLIAGKSTELVCVWQDTEEVSVSGVMWNIPGKTYIFLYATQENRTCNNGTLIPKRSLGVGYRHTNWNTSVRCLNGSALLLTITNIAEDSDAIRISCKSQTASFQSAWYKFDFPNAIPQANISTTSEDVAGYVLSGSDVTLICSWNPEAQNAYFVCWDWPSTGGEYVGDPWLYCYNYAIPKRTCERGHLRERESNSISYPLKGRTSVGCLNESASYINITNVTAADDGISINCWGITFDTSYTLRVYPNHCVNQPCLNSGECINNGTTYHCKCLIGFKGPNCSKMRIWLPVTIGIAIVLLLLIIILISIKVKLLLYPRLQGAVRSDSILSNVHTPYMELGSI